MVLYLFGMNLSHTTYGIKGYDGILGDPSIIQDGNIKEIYTNWSNFLYLKYGSLHIIGTFSSNFYVDQYKKLSAV